MSKHTILYNQHLELGARMVDFAGWSMPLNYGSQIEEHKAVREKAGAFDVSHMCVIDICGSASLPWLQYLLANDAARLEPGQAQYGLILTEEAGILDDLIVYRRKEGYRLVVNAGTRETIYDWLDTHLDGYDVNWIPRDDLAIIAIQGPRALDLFKDATQIDLSCCAAFNFVEGDDGENTGNWMMARTGYTGEQGLELILPEQDAPALWKKLLKLGVAPVGLAARDSLRLEAGMNLSGQDMDTSTHALESGLGWTIAWKPEGRQFIGRERLSAIREAGSKHKLIGLVLEGRGILRHGQKIMGESAEGVITSGIFSPTLGYSIALARVPKAFSGLCEVEIRKKRLPVKVVKPPFVRNGQKVYR